MLKSFTLSSKIKLNLLWSSSLNWLNLLGIPKSLERFSKMSKVNKTARCNDLVERRGWKVYKTSIALYKTSIVSSVESQKGVNNACSMMFR